MFIEIIKENKKTLLIIGIILCFIIISNLLIVKSDPNKLDNSEDYIYTYKKGNNSLLPYINLNSEQITNINIQNLEQYQELLTKNTGTMDYKYYQTKNILSLLVYILDNEGNISISTYNINIQKKSIISDKKLLQQFSLNETDVYNKLENFIYEYYQYEKENKYIDNSCDYNCYKQTNNIDITKDYFLYVKENKLYAYKKFQTTQDFLYDPENPFTLFEFSLT